MSVRRYLIASSLARLVRKERGANRVLEGYFASQSGRNSFVQVDGGRCHLVLINGEDGTEERTEVPRAHADALLDVCPGKVTYDRSRVALPNGREALLDRFTAPAALDILSVTFDGPDQASGFYPPAWFGQEITQDDSFANRSIAIEGAPQVGEVALTNAGLEALLDLFENRFGRYGAAAPTYGQAPAYGQSTTQAAQPSAAPRRNEDGNVMDALRRFATTSAAPAPARDIRPAAEVEAPAEASEAESVDDEADGTVDTVATTSRPEDMRIDDVLHGLSQALEAYSDPEPEGAERQPAGAVLEVDQWAARLRRSEG